MEVINRKIRELEDNLKKTIIGELDLEERNVEESLEDALSVTTPDKPGDPRDGRRARHGEKKKEEDYWV